MVKNLSLKENNLMYYMYTDAMYLKNIKDFKPDFQWIIICGFLIKEDSIRRYFGTLEKKNDIYFVEIIPKNTCYLDYCIYNHNYIEDKLLDIFWRDMSHSYSFNLVKDKDLEQQYFCTRGKIIDQNTTHILFKVDRHLMWAKDHEDFYKEYKFISIPKSYIRSINIGNGWQEADLIKVDPVVNIEIFDDKDLILNTRKRALDIEDDEYKIYYSCYNKKFKTGKLL